MSDAKQWYQSKTIWGGIVALAAALGGLFGIDVDAATGQELALALSQAAAALGSIVAIVGRFDAVKPIA